MKEHRMTPLTTQDEQTPLLAPALREPNADPGRICQIEAEPAWIWRGTVPALNGLRALSILVVIASHLSFASTAPLRWLPRAGEMGVEMFFVISGFLIT